MAGGIGRTLERIRALWASVEFGSAPQIHSLEQLQQRAGRRLPRMVREFVDGGSDGEVTLTANRSDFDDVVLRPDVLVDVSTRDTSVEVFGDRLSLPVGLAPAGLARLVHGDGELAAARAAGRRGTILSVSTASSYSIEEIADVATGPLWFQLYLWKDRAVVASLVDRAAAAGYRALCLTVDVPIVGKRVRDLANGMTIPPRVTARTALDAVLHPWWLGQVLAREPITFRNFVGLADGDDASSLGSYVDRELINPAAAWEDLAWLRSRWSGPLVVKGVLSAADADRAIAHGADGVVVSNHGGRQLDGAPSTIGVLEQVADRVAGRAAVFIDGGVRRGADVVRAKALGADAVFVGRPWFWGLAADGEEGVVRMLDILADEIDRTLALVGRPVFSDVGRDLVD